MGEPCQVGMSTGWLSKPYKRLAVQPHLSARPDRPLDGEAGELVAEHYALAF